MLMILDLQPEISGSILNQANKAGETWCFSLKYPSKMGFSYFRGLKIYKQSY